MILTVTLNPSIDISYCLENFNMDTVNQVTDVSKTPGGKGLNVTRVLSQLGDNVVATGLLGGHFGDFIRSGLDTLEIRHQFLSIGGETRHCIAVLHEGQQTEILEKGPHITKDEADAFLNHLKLIFDAATIITVSGSLPKGLPSDYYARLISLANHFNKKVVLDCSGEALRSVLKSSAKPTVIKPNLEELTQLIGKPISYSLDELKSTLQQDIFRGIDWVIVSLGARGAFAKHGNHYYQVTIPKIEVINPVGSGDATVAGIASALEHQLDDINLLKRANVLGMLNAQETLTGHINLTYYQELISQIQVKEV